MAHHMHLGDQVEFVTDAFAELGAPKGAVGVIVDDWADGSNDIEVSDPQTGETIARVRAAEDEVRQFSGTLEIREPRKPGILFGRGDELAADVEEPPMPDRIHLFDIPGYTPAPIAFSTPPAEDAELADDIPWELRDEPPSGPVFY